MFINHDKKFVFIAIPKTGSKSVSAALGQPQHPEPHLYHATILDVLRDRPEVVDYYFFAVVRNPYSRLVSAYHDFTLKRKDQYSEKVKMDKPLLSEFTSFRDFCVRLHDSSWRHDIFFKPQFDYLETGHYNLRGTTCQYENLQVEFDVVCDQLSIPTTRLGFLNRGEYRHAWEHYYEDQKQVDCVTELYRKDFIFGYEKL